ncbi:L-lactate permease [Kitasatospora sp. NPDC088264]|uniref:L-lactate permease n=1 Tax=Kitasatospora sp. NPDC088264 TaxID=3155296 RepID=UPI003424E028
MYRQVPDPLGHPALAALLAATPLLVLLVLLGLVRLKSHWAALAGLATAFLIATAGYGMPLGQAADGALEGAAFGLFPIVWIILGAVWINRLQRASGHFDVIGRTFSSLSGDIRIQAVLIAFCFGAMIESLSGFGTPIAVTSLILLGLGLDPLKAAAVAAFANTAPAAFGSVGNPIQTLAKVTSLPGADLGAMVGRQSAVIAALVPFVLLLLLDGRRGLREVWPVALAAGTGFAVGQFLCSNYLTYQLTDLVASLTSLASVIVLLRIRARRHGPAAETGPRVERAPRRDTLLAFLPYAIITALFALVSYGGPVAGFVKDQDVAFPWPGLHVTSPSGRPVAVTIFDFGWLGAAGTLLLATGVLTALILRVPVRRALRCYLDALHQIRWAALTIACVLALSYLMNLSGMAVSIGTWLAGLGGAFALFSGFTGWFGVALTGSDTSSNALFGAMQVSAAQHIGLSPLLAAATTSTGGVQGKAVAMQNLVIAASAVGTYGREGEVLRKIIGWSLAVLAVLCLLAWLQSTPVLGWMVP